MAGYAKMRSAFKSPNDTILISTTMPTEREHHKYNKGTEAELKEDSPPANRLGWLDTAYIMYSNFCLPCFLMRAIIFALAIYGLYSLLNKI